MSNTITIEYPAREPGIYGRSGFCLSAAELDDLIAQLQASRGREWVHIRVFSDGRYANGRTVLDDFREYAENYD